MNIEKPTIVLFDMDGTTVRHINPRLLGVLEFLDDAMFKIGKVFSKRKKDASLPDVTAPPKKTKSLLVHRALHKFRKKPVEQIVQPCPGIYGLLNLIHAYDIPIGIVSNGLGKGYGYDILEKFNLDGFFEAHIFREDFSKSKPHPDPLLRALKDLKEPLSDDDVIWYIGDRHKDITAALAADKVVPAKIIPFSYGLNASVAVLEKGLGPDHIIMNYHDFTLDLRDILREDGPEKKPQGVANDHSDPNKDKDEKEYLTFPAPLNDNDPVTAA